MSAFRKYSGLLGWAAITFLAGFIAAQFEPGSWYQTINKPAFTPPDTLFPIVWPVLYLCMAVAAWLIWKDYGFTNGRRALKWFGLQLALNAAWSWLFFGRHDIGIALGEIILLWIAILFTIFLFWKKNKTAAYLMIPYILWITFAIALNYAIWQLN